MHPLFPLCSSTHVPRRREGALSRCGCLYAIVCLSLFMPSFPPFYFPTFPSIVPGIPATPTTPYGGFWLFPLRLLPHPLSLRAYCTGSHKGTAARDRPAEITVLPLESIQLGSTLPIPVLSCPVCDCLLLSRCALQTFARGISGR